MFIDVSMLPKDYRFSGNIKQSDLIMGSGIYVPDNEKEIIMNVTSGKNVIFHQTHFETGHYQGDYKVDTIGLTKRAVTWHISPF